MTAQSLRGWDRADRAVAETGTVHRPLAETVLEVFKNLVFALAPERVVAIRLRLPLGHLPAHAGHEFRELRSALGSQRLRQLGEWIQRVRWLGNRVSQFGRQTVPIL